MYVFIFNIKFNIKLKKYIKYLLKFSIFIVISDYLQDQANLMPRIGAVGVGGLSGLILSLRGGIFKRLMYTTTGAAIVGCVCFPKETKETVNTMEHYGNVSYNFIYGGMYIYYFIILLL